MTSHGLVCLPFTFFVRMGTVDQWALWTTVPYIEIMCISARTRDSIEIPTATHLFSGPGNTKRRMGILSDIFVCRKSKTSFQFSIKHVTSFSFINIILSSKSFDTWTGECLKTRDANTVSAAVSQIKVFGRQSKRANRFIILPELTKVGGLTGVFHWAHQNCCFESYPILNC